MPQTKERRRELYYERKAQGLCVACGKNGSEDGKNQCLPCLEKGRPRHLASVKRRMEWLKNARLCQGCSIPLDPAWDILLCDACRKKASIKSMRVAEKRHKRREASGLCRTCGGKIEEGTFINCAFCRHEKTVWRKASPTYAAERENQRIRQQALKLEVFTAYGGAVCACCGELHMEFLSIDHINGGGQEHRNPLSRRERNYYTGTKLYWWLKRQNFPPGFRVLCMNCNFARGRFGYCPHEKQSE